MSEHYFSASPSSRRQWVPVRARVWGHDLDLVSAPGVFAQGRVDIGTAMLFRSLDPPAAGTLLDLGCGYGLIAAALAAAVPGAAVWAVDVNERALQLTRENADRTGVADRVRACLPDQVDDEVVFDQIWSNPPIRIGKLAAARTPAHGGCRGCTPDGRAARLVVSKNLGADSLQGWLRAEGYDCARLASAKGFRVLDVRPTS